MEIDLRNKKPEVIVTNILHFLSINFAISLYSDKTMKLINDIKMFSTHDISENTSI